MERHVGVALDETRVYDRTACVDNASRLVLCQDL
jgi:hypothetical protein